LVVIATSLDGETGPNKENSRKFLPFSEKIAKICLVDTEIALLRVNKNKTRNVWQSLAYSPLGATMSPLASSSGTKPC